MHTHRSLASVAQLELDALLQDTKSAVDSLKRQRESVTQAIESAQRANERPGGPLSNETVVQVVRLLDQLHRLNAALERVTREIEWIEANPIPPGLELFITLPLSRTRALISDKHP